MPVHVGTGGQLPPSFTGRPGSQYGRVEIVAHFEAPGLDTLPQRLHSHLAAHLQSRVAQVADMVIEDARMQLQPGHGYDTGLLHESLTKHLVDTFLDEFDEDAGVYYELGSDQAPYWVYVEFGHLTRSGSFWQGYHYLSSALEMNMGHLREAALLAWQDTVHDLAAEAAIGNALMAAGLL